jgi:SAM domain (Sterile alpha motif)
MDIVVCLRGPGLGKYEAAFRDNDIDETVLPNLMAEDLKEIGVTANEGAARAKNGGRAMKKFIAAAAFVAAQWQLANAQTILGSIPEEFRGDWCWQENTDNEQVFKSGACKVKAGSLSIDRITLDKGRLSCLFDSGTTSDGILNMRLHCSEVEKKQPSMYGAQIKLRPDKKIELIMESIDQW